MSKTILLTGGTGLIGSRLAQVLVHQGHKVLILSRSSRENQPDINYIQWDVQQEKIDTDRLKGVEIVIHLAGASVAKRWTKPYKKTIIDSRVDSAKLLLNTLTNADIQLDAYIGASASGFYPRNENKKFKETASKGNDFLSDVCEQWENAHQQFTKIAKRIVIHRIGVVLAKDGGALEPMVQPVKMGIAPYFGKGKQFYPWIHIEDIVQQFAFSVEQQIEGIFNASTDNVTQKILNHSIAKALGKKAIHLPAPTVGIKLAMGEMHQIVTDSYQMNNDKIKATGFQPMFHDIDDALADLLR